LKAGMPPCKELLLRTGGPLICAENEEGQKLKGGSSEPPLIREGKHKCSLPPLDKINISLLNRLVI
jgi:hypothetical protein